MRVLTADDILAADDLERQLVEVPEWGGSVFVRGLTGLERDSFEAGVVDQRNKGRLNLQNFRARLCALTMVGEQGERLFNEAQAEALGRKSAQALQRVFEVAQRLSGLSAADVSELTDELRENPTSGSSTGSV